ncbi:tetraacyldisaccharide 4'-kinase [Apibacter muscae]|nr:tetraacyldisaccharide 4'-kinase [Apibacter muscae]
MNMKIILLPFSGLYWLGTFIRNKFFDWGILQSKKYKKPVIAVGNLSVGGTGKSPFVIYLIDLLKDKYLMGILSRGYGRQTKGYQFANYETTFEDIGDEPMQFFERFRNKIVVGVDEKRIRGIKNMLKDFNPDLFILDDAFQHRYVKAGLNILLTDYSKPYYEDEVLPAGRLREGKYAAKRAQIVIVTKCPDSFTEKERDRIQSKLNLQPSQALFFSRIVYENRVISSNYSFKLENLVNFHILLITGIAKYNEILSFSEQNFETVTHLNFKDHHNFTNADIQVIEKKYKEISGNKMILTTEKDYMRLKHFQQIKNYLFYLPISIEIDRAEDFEKLILNYINKN